MPRAAAFTTGVAASSFILPSPNLTATRPPHYINHIPHPTHIS
jgi:hypothetical protein